MSRFWDRYEGILGLFHGKTGLFHGKFGTVLGGKNGTIHREIWDYFRVELEIVLSDLFGALRVLLGRSLVPAKKVALKLNEQTPLGIERSLCGIEASQHFTDKQASVIDCLANPFPATSVCVGLRIAVP